MLVPSSGVQATVPDNSDTFETGAKPRVSALGLARIWSPTEPHRNGEFAFPPPFKFVFCGRGDDQPELFQHFGPHRPGRSPDASRGTCLGGDGMSRRQGLMRATAVAIEVMNIGQCRMFVNDVELMKVEGDPMAAWDRPGAVARLEAGGILEFYRQARLLCLRRHLVLPQPDETEELHAFGEPDDDGYVGESEAAWEYRRELRLAARSGRAHVFVQGETGAGKAMASKVIHRNSKRAKGPHIVAANLTESIIESELFGNRANYPNAGQPERTGLFGQADGGTLFIDEVGNLPLKVQQALLHALDKGEYVRLGESVARRADVRVVAATSRDDSALLRDFRMRFPLTIRVPPVRERPEDIPLLVQHLMLEQLSDDPTLKRFFREGPTGRLEVNISGKLVDYLLRHELLGNVRELDRILRQAAKSESTVLRSPASSGAPPSSSTPAATPSDAPPEIGPDGVVTEAALLKVLVIAEWNVTRAARILGMHRNAVDRLRIKYGLRRDKTRP
jgi:DNA-binding NtrC family response regulator